MKKVIPGHIYPLLEHGDVSLSKYVCLAEIDKNTHKLMRLGDGWTIEASNVQINDYGYIYWDGSTGGHWPDGAQPMENLYYFKYQNHVMENAVNIAMTAGVLKHAGKIDTQGGHRELTWAVVDLAEQFERDVASKTDYNAPPDFDNLRDYWVEIDDYAEENLSERFGSIREPIPVLFTYPESNGELPPELVIMINPDEDFKISNEAVHTIISGFQNKDSSRLEIRDKLVGYLTENCQDVQVYLLPEFEIEITP